MKVTAFIGARVVTPSEEIPAGVVVVQGSQIAGVYPDVDDFRQATGDIEADEVKVDGLILCPGFIDIHIHGLAGGRVTDGPDAVARMCAELPRFGVTSFLPTIGAEPLDRMEKAIHDVVEGSYAGASIAGIHLEGPFINSQRRGAQREDAIIPPSVDVMAHLFGRAKGMLRLVTLAPELDGAGDVIKYLREQDVVVAAGHSDATYAEMVNAFAAGVQLVTHTFNAMRPLQQREPGVVGAALAYDGAACEIIADLIHVHPAVIEILLRCKGVDSVVVVTDGSEFTGLPDGSYTKADGRAVTVRDGRVELSGGTIAGSAAPMSRSVRNLRVELGLGWSEVVKLVSANPARVIGLGDRKGSISPGKDGDLVFLDDGGEVHAAYVMGRLQYSRDSDWPAR